MLGKPSKRLKKRLEEKGNRAKAVVVEIADSGMAVTHGAEGVIGHTELVRKAHLRVQPDDEPEFEVKKRFSFPQLALPSAGQTVPVLYDPSDHDKIIVDYSPEAQQSAALGSAGIDTASREALAQRAEQLRAAARQLRGAAEARTGGTGQQPPTQPQVNPVEQLERLAKLKEQGALSEAEFEAEKAKIIGS